MSKKAEKKEMPKKEEPKKAEEPKKGEAPKKEAKKAAVEVTVEAPKEEGKPPKVEKAPKPERKKEEKGVFRLFKVENDKVTRLRPTCERCGPGYFMADHGNRYTCGHCGFTRYKPVKE